MLGVEWSWPSRWLSLRLPERGQATPVEIYGLTARVFGIAVSAVSYLYLTQAFGLHALFWGWLPALVIGVVAGALWPATLGGLIYLAIWYLIFA